MTELQLSLLLRYIDASITAAIEHEIGGEPNSWHDLKDNLRKQLLNTTTQLGLEQMKIQQAEISRQGAISQIQD